MARSPSQRLEPLQQLAESREDEASRRMLDAQRLLAEREARLAELARYRADYERGPVEGSPRLLLNHRLFLDRLREAEHFQRQLVEQSQLEIARERAQWLTRHRETATLDQLADLYRRRERAREERAAQKQLDEFALRARTLTGAGEAAW